jgi:hypothetical protein
MVEDAIDGTRLIRESKEIIGTRLKGLCQAAHTQSGNMPPLPLEHLIELRIGHLGKLRHAIFRETSPVNRAL